MPRAGVSREADDERIVASPAGILGNRDGKRPASGDDPDPWRPGAAFCAFPEPVTIACALVVCGVTR